MRNETIVAAVTRAFEKKETCDLVGLLATEVELRPPTYGKSWHGVALVSHLLGFAAQSFDALHYTDVSVSDAMIVMRFEAQVGGKALSGVDVLRLDENGRIAVFEIFSRPPRVALALLDRMTALVEESPDTAALMQESAR